jgi:hypothetical protein
MQGGLAHSSGTVILLSKRGRVFLSMGLLGKGPPEVGLSHDFSPSRRTGSLLPLPRQPPVISAERRHRTITLSPLLPPHTFLTPCNLTLF